MSKRPGPIHLLQLSDPHLFSDSQGGMFGLNTLHSLRAVLADVAGHYFDAGVVTGDLSQDLSPASYRQLHQELAALPMPLYLIPGNHDDRGLIEAEFSGSRVSSHRELLIGPWQIILLDSQIPGEVGGHLTDGELARLERLLAQGSAAHALVCVHHHPVAMGSKWLDQVGLENGYKLFEILAAHPKVKALLWGHVHQEFDESRAGVRLLSCPSTCIQFKPGCDRFELDLLPPGYRWLRLFDDGTLETGVRRLDTIPGQIDANKKGY